MSAKGPGVYQMDCCPPEDLSSAQFGSFEPPISSREEGYTLDQTYAQSVADPGRNPLALSEQTIVLCYSAARNLSAPGM